MIFTLPMFSALRDEHGTLLAMSTLMESQGVPTEKHHWLMNIIKEIDNLRDFELKDDKEVYLCTFRLIDCYKDHKAREEEHILSETTS